MFITAPIWEDLGSGDIMNASLLAVLNDQERLVVAETEPAALTDLDEDAAIELESRIRRARNKYVGQYRRRASTRVEEKGGRGKARPQNERAAMKAEAFELALARVSRRVAVLAQKAAAQLRAERIEAAREANRRPAPAGGRPASAGGRPASAGGRPARARSAPAPRRPSTAEPRGDRALRSPASEKQRASTQATGDRRQARRDSKRALAK
jgi:hypothetical protein